MSKIVTTLAGICGLTVKAVKIPSLKKTVHIKHLNGAARQKFADFSSMEIDDPQRPESIDAFFVGMSLCDAEGKLIADGDDGYATLCTEVPGQALAEIADEICFLNGFKEKAITDAKKP